MGPVYLNSCYFEADDVETVAHRGFVSGGLAGAMQTSGVTSDSRDDVVDEKDSERGLRAAAAAVICLVIHACHGT